jgi:hypothetical protein
MQEQWEQVLPVSICLKVTPRDWGKAEDDIYNSLTTASWDFLQWQPQIDPISTVHGKGTAKVQPK